MLSIKTLSTDTNYNGMKVYRFFEKKEYAEALYYGNVWISTLETCRQYELEGQGDPGEATHVYHSGKLYGGGDDSDFVRAAANAGIHIGSGCSNITIENCTSINKIHDAFVLCTTKEFQPKNLSETFGRYCVEISNIPLFFYLVTAELVKKANISDSLMGTIKYKNRNFHGFEQPPGPIGFVKPKDKYATQKEFRFLWHTEEKKIKPMLVQCPSISRLCKII